MSEQPRAFTIVSEFREDLYRDILLEARRHCDRFSLVQRRGVPVSEAASSIWLCLSPYLLSERNVSEWPGTKLLRGTAVLREYTLSDESVRELAGAVRAIFDWRHPDRPEDLILWRTAGKPWLVTIAHERDAYFELTSSEYESLMKAMPDLLKFIVSI